MLFLEADGAAFGRSMHGKVWKFVVYFSEFLAPPLAGWVDQSASAYRCVEGTNPNFQLPMDRDLTSHFSLIRSTFCIRTAIDALIRFSQLIRAVVH